MKHYHQKTFRNESFKQEAKCALSTSGWIVITALVLLIVFTFIF